MARTYDVTDLALNDPTSADWALAYVRFVLRDKPNDADAYPIGSLLDAEINAALEGQALEDDDDGSATTYYPAHRVAARLLSANPEFVQRWSAAGVSQEFRNAKDLARDIITAGSWVDVTISTLTDGRLAPGQLRLSS
jgi:hypothetical protein